MIADNYTNSLETRMYYYLTNQHNLNYIISHGYIAPSYLYNKYYEDLSALTKGHLPILLDSPNKNLIDQVVSKEASSFPIILSLDLGNLTGVIKRVNSNYDLVLTSQLDDIQDADILILLEGLIPFRYVNQIIFADEQSLEEFTARQFGNIPGTKEKVTVNSNLFDGSNGDPNKLIPVLEKLTADKSPRLAEIKKFNQLCGSRVLLTQLASTTEDTPLESLATYLSDISEIDDVASDAKNIWLRLLPKIILSDEAEPLSSNTLNNLSSSFTQQQIADTLLLEQIVLNLTKLNSPSEFVSEIFLDQVVNDFEKRIMIFESDTEALKKQYDSIFSRIRKVLLSSIDLDEFFSFLADDTKITIALLCFLLRPEPENILTWLDEKHAPDWDILAIIYILSGILYGRSRIPVEYRPSSEMMEYIDYSNCQDINALFGCYSFSTSDTPQILQLDIKNIEGRSVETLHINGNTLLERNINTISLSQIKSYFNVNTLKDSEALDLALNFAKLQGWTECITSVIDLDGYDFYLHFHQSRQEFRVQGIVEIDEQLNINEFLQNIEQSTSENLENLTESWIARFMRNSR